MIPFSLKEDSVSTMNFDTGHIITENDIFSVSSISISIKRGEVFFYITTEENNKQYIKEEILSKQSSFIFIPPAAYVDTNKLKQHHMQLAFTNVYNIHFIDAKYGIGVTFKHDTGRRYSYDDSQEYVYQSYILL